MRKVLWMVVLGLALIQPLAAQQKNVPVWGNWDGEFLTSDWQDRTIRAQIVARSGGNYDCVLYVGKENVDEARVIVKGKTQKKITYFDGEVDLGTELGKVYSVHGKIEKNQFTGTFRGADGEASFKMQRVLLEPPTRGKEPPAGAIVLLGLPASQAQLEENFYIYPLWQVNDQGAVLPTYSSLVTKDKFGDAEIHLEFMTPFMPNDSGQARGNSGVYVMERYEVQVLDSFGEIPRDNLCGGIYQVAVPNVDAVLPPLEWQTYDITIRAPRYDGNGNKTQNAVMTVVHNGKVIHKDLELRKPTPGGVSNKDASEGGLKLQYHNDRVRYRNIWVKPLD